MSIPRDVLAQVQHLMRPVATRLANTVARAVIQLVDDAKKLQLVQLGVLEDEAIDGAEHHQSYGLSSVPLPGAEAVVVFPLGDRGHPLVVAVSDRRHRPTGRPAGEVCLYTDEGDVIRLGRGHVISLETSGTVRLGSAGAAGDVVVQAALDLLVQALTNAANSAALAPAPMAPGKLALVTLLTALTTGVAPPAPPIAGLAAGWKAGTSKTKAE